MKLRMKGAAAEIAALLKNKGDAAVEAAQVELHAQARRIIELSREGAPVDDHDLEKAHRMRTRERGKRIEISVELNRLDSDGRPIGRYAERMHEGIYNLGPNSLKKQAGQQRLVGRKYLQRASDEVSPEIVPAVARAIKEAL